MRHHQHLSLRQRDQSTSRVVRAEGVHRDRHARQTKGNHQEHVLVPHHRQLQSLRVVDEEIPQAMRARRRELVATRVLHDEVDRVDHEGVRAVDQLVGAVGRHHDRRHSVENHRRAEQACLRQWLLVDDVAVARLLVERDVVQHARVAPD